MTRFWDRRRAKYSEQTTTVRDFGGLFPCHRLQVFFLGWTTRLPREVQILDQMLPCSSQLAKAQATKRPTLLRFMRSDPRTTGSATAQPANIHCQQIWVGHQFSIGLHLCSDLDYSFRLAIFRGARFSGTWMKPWTLPMQQRSLLENDREMTIVKDLFWLCGGGIIIKLSG